MIFNSRKFDGLSLPLERQRGAITMFSAVLILILLTELIIFAVQVGVFEQRKSSNEARQKEAFHVADSAIQVGKEFMIANAYVVATNEDDVLFGDDDSDGWLPGSSNPHWRPCIDANLSAGSGTHPCFAEPASAAAVADKSNNINVNLRDSMYFFMLDPDDDPDVLANLELPVNTGDLLADTTQHVATYALLCMMRVNTNNALLSPPEPIVEGCTMEESEWDQRYFMITLLARGEADCDVGGTCTAKALIADKIGSLGPGRRGAGPGAPLTTKSSFPPQGNVDIVANPNGGGLGVPMSVWISDDVFNALDLDNASWATCERHEWYRADSLSDDFKCSLKKNDGGNNCTCSVTGTDRDKRLSHPNPGEDPTINIDFVIDPEFPELFEYTFGYPKDPIGIDTVKGMAVEVLDSCDSSVLNERSVGLYWVEGDCTLPSGNDYLSTPPVKQIGSPGAPVFLVLAGADNSIGAAIDIFGVVMLTDAENSGATIKGNGSATIYGMMIVDAPNDAMDSFNGTLGLVYLESVIEQALGEGNFGAVAGGWSDFHRDWR